MFALQKPIPTPNTSREQEMNEEGEPPTGEVGAGMYD